MNIDKFNIINLNLSTEHFIFFKDYLIINKSNQIQFLNYLDTKIAKILDFTNELIYIDIFLDKLNNEKILIIDNNYNYSIFDLHTDNLEFKSLNCIPKIFSKIIDSHLFILTNNNILINFNINENFSHEKITLNNNNNYTGIDKFDIFYILYNEKEIHFYNQNNLIKKINEDINKLKVFDNNILCLSKLGDLMIYNKFDDKYFKKTLRWHSNTIEDICYDELNNTYYTGGHEGVLVEWKNNFSKKDFLPRFEDVIQNLQVKNGFIAVGLKNKIILINNYNRIYELWGISSTPNMLSNSNNVLLYNEFNEEIKMINTLNNSINCFNLNNNNFLNKNKYQYSINDDYLCILEDIADNFKRIKFFDLHKNLSIINFIRYSFKDKLIFIKLINNILVTVSDKGNIILFKNENRSFSIFSIHNLKLEKIIKVSILGNFLIILTHEEIIKFDYINNIDTSIFYEVEKFKNLFILNNNINVCSEKKLYVYDSTSLKLIKILSFDAPEIEFHEISNENFIIKYFEENNTILKIFNKQYSNTNTIIIKKLLTDCSISSINDQLLVTHKGEIYSFSNINLIKDRVSSNIITETQEVNQTPQQNSSFNSQQAVNFSNSNMIFKNINITKDSHLIPNFRMLNNELFEINLIHN